MVDQVQFYEWGNPELPEHNTWYRLPEREHTGYKLRITDDKREPDVLRNGDWVRFDRKIVRVGYYWEPTDMPLDLLNQRIMEELIALTNGYLGNPNYKPETHSILAHVRNRWPVEVSSWHSNTDKPVDQEQLLAVMLALSHGSPAGFGRLVKETVFRLRGEWRREQATKPEDQDIRTFWYVDTSGASKQVCKVVSKAIGKRYDGHVSGGYEDGYDYEPPAFGRWSTTGLAALDPWNMNGDFLHPLDINPKEVRMSGETDVVFEDEGLVVKKFIDESDNIRLSFTFHQSEAEGKIDICAGAYGLWIISPDENDPEKDATLALVDLFYASPEGKAGPGGPPVEVITYDLENDDHHMKSKYYPGKPLEKLQSIDVCDLSDKWYDQFKGGCYWSGIMSAYLWDNLGLEEETIWERLLKHLWVDKEHYLVRFKFGKDLPLDMWLRGTSKQGDVAINTETLFRFATKFVIDQEDFFELKEVELEEEVA